MWKSYFHRFFTEPSHSDASSHASRVRQPFLVRKSVRISLARLAEEAFQNLDTVFSEHSRGDFRAVIEILSLQKVPETSCGAAFDIGTAKDDPPDPAMHQRTGAHRTGFLGDIEITITQAPVAHRTLRLGQGDHLGMRGGILQGFDLIPGAGDDFPLVDNDRADRHFVLRRGLPG